MWEEETNNVATLTVSARTPGTLSRTGVPKLDVTAHLHF